MSKKWDAVRGNDERVIEWLRAMGVDTHMATHVTIDIDVDCAVMICVTRMLPAPALKVLVPDLKPEIIYIEE